MTLHEQARAEAESLWPHEQYRTERPTVGERARRAFVQGAEWAATRTREVSTVDQLDALPVGSVVRLGSGQVFERDHDGFWAEPGFTWRPMSKDMALPARVLYDPEETR